MPNGIGGVNSRPLFEQWSEAATPADKSALVADCLRACEKAEPQLRARMGAALLLLEAKDSDFARAVSQLDMGSQAAWRSLKSEASKTAGPLLAKLQEAQTPEAKQAILREEVAAWKQADKDEAGSLAASLALAVGHLRSDPGAAPLFALWERDEKASLVEIQAQVVGLGLPDRGVARFASSNHVDEPAPWVNGGAPFKGAGLREKLHAEVGGDPGAREAGSASGLERLRALEKNKGLLVGARSPKGTRILQLRRDHGDYKLYRKNLAEVRHLVTGSAHEERLKTLEKTLADLDKEGHRLGELRKDVLNSIDETGGWKQEVLAELKTLKAKKEAGGHSPAEFEHLRMQFKDLREQFDEHQVQLEGHQQHLVFTDERIEAVRELKGRVEAARDEAAGISDQVKELKELTAGLPWAEIVAFWMKLPHRFTKKAEKELEAGALREVLATCWTAVAKRDNFATELRELLENGDRKGASEAAAQRLEINPADAGRPGGGKSKRAGDAAGTRATGDGEGKGTGGAAGTRKAISADHGAKEQDAVERKLSELEEEDPGAAEVIRTYHQARLNHTERSYRTFREIDAILHSGMPIEVIIMMVMVKLTENEEDKFKTKLQELGAAQQLEQVNDKIKQHNQGLNREIKALQARIKDVRKEAGGGPESEAERALKQKIKDLNATRRGDLNLEDYGLEAKSSVVLMQEMQVAQQMYMQVMNALTAIMRQIQDLVNTIIRNIRS